MMKTSSLALPEESLVNPYREWSRLCWWLALASLTVGAVATTATLTLAADQALIVIPLVLAATGLISSAVSAMAFAYYTPMVDRHLGEFRRGNCLAHWTYEPGEWAGFAEAEWAGRRAEARLAVVVFGVFGLLLGLGLWLGAGVGPLGLVGGGAVGVALGAGIGWVTRHLGRRAYRRALRRVGETYIGPEAAYFNGSYHCWATWGVRLLCVAYHEGETSVLSLTIGMNANRNYTLRILVPSGREEEARRVARWLGSVDDGS
jgi:hypothetical protein